MKEMQQYMDLYDTHNLHRCIKNIVGPVKKPLNVIESITGEHLNTKEEIMERWREHFHSVLNQDTSVDLDSIRAPISAEGLVYPDDEHPSINEIRRAVGQLKNHKSAGSDVITAELLKGGGEATINMLFALFRKSWEEIAFSELKKGRRPQYKPKKRWIDLLKEDIHLVGLNIKL